MTARIARSPTAPISTASASAVRALVAARRPAGGGRLDARRMRRTCSATSRRDDGAAGRPAARASRDADRAASSATAIPSATRCSTRWSGACCTASAHLLEIATDPLVHRLERMAKSVRRDLHKMHAFVRFRRIEVEDGERFVAWFEPEHFILEATAPFFVDRFRALDWSILTPIGSLHWDRERLAFGPPGPPRRRARRGPFEEGWRGYYESIFNPARVNPTSCAREMPKKYWRNLPETAADPGLIRTPPSRVSAMIEQGGRHADEAQPRRRPSPRCATRSPKSLARAQPPHRRRRRRWCRAATQAVLGEGPVGAAIAFVGEQPGDQEDLQGRPFVGPAGQLLDRALAEAGIDRARGLRHQRGQAFQVRAARQAPPAPASRPPARSSTTAGG